MYRQLLFHNSKFNRKELGFEIFDFINRLAVIRQLVSYKHTRSHKQHTTHISNTLYLTCFLCVCVCVLHIILRNENITKDSENFYLFIFYR